MTIIPQKHCKRCNQHKPATPEYFRRDRGRPDGLYPTCMECQKRAYRDTHPLKEVPVPEGYKRCTVCRQDFPATTDYYHRNRAQHGGLNNECKVCKNRRSKIYDQSPQVRGERLVRQSVWNDAHKEYHREYCKEYNQVNREALRPSERVRASTRRARKKAVPGTYTPQDIQKQYERQKGRCYYCSKKIKWGQHQVDHIIPITREGSSNDPSNLVIACAFCNISKGNKLPHEWIRGGRLL